ncbi:hypothetical protein AX774_g6011 [Zancudomyces culisetae]|uniref:Uncharacterized protein n=1 Tax=Zancudomyces culisetae TaxID=1213189 RepID=A0A1R1PHU5_ZANCU|nr:hypothetical protein AX774_g6011 [Zancudomyces culisetae]|eukprot:OMH80551.1 hypothetical protein AX774_g6011 [Zancudomyces culisetae]
MDVNDGLDNEKQPVEMDADKVYRLEDNNQGSQENEDGDGDGDGDDYSDGDGNGNGIGNGDGDGDNIYDLDKHLYDTQSVIDNQGYTGLNISYEVGDMGGMGDIGEPELYKINGSPEYNGGMYTDSGIEEQVEFTNESTGERAVWKLSAVDVWGNV